MYGYLSIFILAGCHFFPRGSAWEMWEIAPSLFENGSSIDDVVLMDVLLSWVSHKQAALEYVGRISTRSRACVGVCDAVELSWLARFIKKKTKLATFSPSDATVISAIETMYTRQIFSCSVQ